MKRWLKALIAGLILFGLLLGLSAAMPGSELLLILTFPGGMANLLLTGFHGGSESEQLWGWVLHVGLNAAIYAVVIWVLLLVRDRRKG